MLVLFIYALFNDAVSSSERTVSNDRVVTQLLSLLWEPVEIYFAHSVCIGSIRF